MMWTGQTLTEIWRFNGFPNDGRTPSCILLNFDILTGSTVQKDSMHHRIKYRCDQLNRRRNMASAFIFLNGGRPPSCWIFNYISKFEQSTG